MADAISSGSCPILFKVLTLNVATCIVCLHFCNFCCLSSVVDFSNTEARAPTSAGHAPFFTRECSDAVWTYGLSVGHGYLSVVVFICIFLTKPGILLIQSCQVTEISKVIFKTNKTSQYKRNWRNTIFLLTFLSNILK